MKRMLAMLLAVLMLLAMLTVFASAEESVPADPAAEEVIPMEPTLVTDKAANAITHSTYSTRINEFVNDSRWKDRTSWDGGVRPKLSGWSSWGCCAYVADFAAYVYGCYGNINTSPDNGNFEVFYDQSQIRTGDIIHFTFMSGGEECPHWFVVLGRTGDTLYTAEANYASQVRVFNGKRYIENGKLRGPENVSYFKGFHYKFIDDANAMAYKKQCTAYPTYGTLKVTKNGANVNDRPCSRNTQSDTRTLFAGDSAATYTVTAVYKNTEGNYWFEIETNVGQPGYIYSGNCEYYPNYNDVVSTAAVPGSAAMDGTLKLTGKIYSKSTKIQSATVTLYKENGTKYKSQTLDAVNNQIDMSGCSFQLSEAAGSKLTCKVTVNVAHFNINTGKYPTGSTRSFDVGTVTLACVNHSFGNWYVTKDFTCTVDGEWSRKCTRCGHIETKPDPALGHNWTVKNSSGVTCTSPGYTVMTCLNCAEETSETVSVTWSDWTAEYPDTSLDRIETKKQYRYRNWISAAQTSQSGTVDYVRNWPYGFNSTNSYYATYNQTPKTPYENDTERLVVASDEVVGYLYWHWCRGRTLEKPYNSAINSEYTDTYKRFHAYYSTNNIAYNSSAGAWNAGNYSCCQDSYWFFQLPVYRQTYRIESKSGAEGQWGSWSEWSETAVTATATREVETRNLYRYINGGLANHKWGTPVRTKEPTNTTEGELTYTCSVCNNKKIEILPKLNNGECEHSQTVRYGKVEPTCTEKGYSGDLICAVCGETVTAGKATPAAGHTEVKVAGKAATCTESGKTDGKKCSVCGTVTVKQKTIKAKGHSYTDDLDTTCNTCGAEREVVIPSVPMFRMYDPNSGEHFYTGSEVERDFLMNAGWHYEGVGFNFPVEGAPVYRLYEPVHGEHLYTMDLKERSKLLAEGWNDEGVAFNSAGTDEVPQYRLHNPNSKRGAYHFTGSTEERDFLISIGWEFQGIGWYSCLE